MPVALQSFKANDLIEAKMKAAAEPALLTTEASLDQFYNEGDQSAAFLLMLYDEGRIPYSNRIDRDVFVAFFQRAVENFPFMGNAESYLFILREIFGEESEILFEVPAPGKLNISVNAISDVVYDAIVRELEDEVYTFFTLADDVGDDIVFRGIAGIETEYELGLLFAEMMPYGIFPGISLDFFTKSIWIGEDDVSGIFGIIDSDENEIVFIEIGE